MNLDKCFLKKYNDLMNEDVKLALEFSINALNESNNADFYAYIADCYMSLDEFNEAINVLKKGLDNNCTNSIYTKSFFYLQSHHLPNDPVRHLYNANKHKHVENQFPDISPYYCDCCLRIYIRR